MKFSRAAALLSIGWLGACAPLAAAFDSGGVGTSGGQFLKLPPDARGAALGQAMSAAAEDSTALHWNPAGLAGLADKHISLTHIASYQSVFYDYLAYAQPVESLFPHRRREINPSGLGALGVGLLYLNAGQLQEIDNAGRATGGAFTPSDAALTAGWGGTFTQHLDLGLALKYVRSTIRRTVSTGAVDVGARLRLRVGEMPVILALSERNMGGQLKYNTQNDPLPASLHGGISIQPRPFWLLSADAALPRDNVPFFGFGSELDFPVSQKMSFALRGGFSSLPGAGELDGLAGIAFGGGMTVAGFGIDYAWAPYGALGDVHRFTLSCRF